MRTTACILIVLAVSAFLLIRWASSQKPGSPPAMPASQVEEATPATPPARHDERFFKQVWPVAKARVFDKLAGLGFVNPLGTNAPQITQIKFLGPETSLLCVAKLNNKITLGYHYTKLAGLNLEGVHMYIEGGNDQNGIPNEADTIITMLQDPNVAQPKKEEIKARLGDTNLYPRLDMTRATELANRVLQAFAERPDEYVLNQQQEQADWSPVRFFTFDRKNSGNVDPANLAQKDSIFIKLRTTAEGIHLEHYSSSYYVFEGEAAVHGRR